jgi:hypothetical protein
VNEQTWAVLAGAVATGFLVSVNAVIRWFFPPSRISNWAMRHSQPLPDREDETG